MHNNKKSLATQSCDWEKDLNENVFHRSLMEDERYFHEEPAVSFNIGRGLNMFILEHLYSYTE